MARPDKHDRGAGLGQFNARMHIIPDPTPAALIPGVVDEQERVASERLFGVVKEQVVRDHAISHTLGGDRHTKVPFTRIPTDAEWRAVLDHPRILAASLETAAKIFREALAATSP